MRSFALAALATVALADTQIKFFVPGMDTQNDGGVDPVASIVKAEASTTVMALACPTGSDDTECGWGSNDITISVISNSIYALTFDALGGEAMDCTSKKDMTCTAKVQIDITDSGDMFTVGSDGMATATTVYPSNEIVFQTASVTAGEEKLSGGAVAASGSATKTGGSSTLATSAASTGASAGTSGTSATGTAASATDATASGTGAPAEATPGAASKFGIEGAALLALAGAAFVHAL